MSGGSKTKKLNSVFYADTYHPIQAGSIDGTDTLPHDNAVSRALLCSSASLYDPFGDPKVIGDPYCTVFVSRLSHLTTEDTLLKAMSKYGRVKNLRLVRHIVTGASRGYGFVEYETERDMRRAYKDAHHSFIDDSEIMVDYCRQLLMPGWIPRRLGGGLGGRKESGQLRFGGRERPFRAPLQQIPYDDLKRLGIPPPPEGRYMSRFEVPSPPRRKHRSSDREEGYAKRSPMDKEEHRKRSSSIEKQKYGKAIYDDEEEPRDRRHSVEREERRRKWSSRDKEEHRKRSSSIEKRKYGKTIYDDEEEPCDRRQSVEREERCRKWSSIDRPERSRDTISMEREDQFWKRSYVDQEKHYDGSSVEEEESSRERSSRKREGSTYKRHRNGNRSERHSRRPSASRNHSSDHHDR